MRRHVKGLHVAGFVLPHASNVVLAVGSCCETTNGLRPLDRSNTACYQNSAQRHCEMVSLTGSNGSELHAALLLVFRVAFYMVHTSPPVTVLSTCMMSMVG